MPRIEYPTPWITHDAGRPGVYGEEAKCHEHALFDSSDNMVGKPVTGFPYYIGRHDPYVQYGLTLKVRQKKQYVPRAKRKSEQKEVLPVRIERYDTEGCLINLTQENRTVYTNSKGSYIKTRSEGNPRITYVANDGTNVIVQRFKQVTRKVHNSGHVAYRQVWTQYFVEPDEWSAA